MTRVGDICLDLQYGYTASAASEPCGPRFLRITDIQDGRVQWSSVPYCEIDPGQIERYALRANDIVFARTGGTVGKSFIISSVPQTCVFASYLIRLTSHPKVDARFLYHFFQSLSYWEQIGLKKGGLQGNVNATVLASLDLPLCPLNEQCRIVAKIEELFSELDRAVESLTAAREQLKVHRRSVLKHAFEGKLTADWRAQNPISEPARDLKTRIDCELERSYLGALESWETAVDKWQEGDCKGKRPAKPRRQETTSPPSPEDLGGFPVLPEGWGWVRLGELVWSVKDGPHYSPPYVAEGVPFISGGNVRPCGVDFETAKLIRPELHRELLARCKPEKGDLLYTKGGTTGIARVNTYDHEFSVWVHVAVLKLAKSVRPFYLQHALNSPLSYAQSQKYTHGVGNQDLGLTRMVNIIVPLCSEAEQEQVEDVISGLESVFDQTEAAINTILGQAQALRHSILRRAFSGQLVPQDPNDEPAPALLELIRAERAQAASRQKSRKKSKEEAA